MPSFASNILQPDANQFFNNNLETQLAIQAAQNPLARGSLTLARGRNDRGREAFQEAQGQANELIQAITQQEMQLAREQETRQLLNTILSGVGSDGAQQLLSGVNSDILGRIFALDQGAAANINTVTQNAVNEKELDNLVKAMNAANTGSQAGVNPNIGSLEQMTGVGLSQSEPRSTTNARINAMDSIIKALNTKTGNKTVTETDTIRGKEMGSTTKRTDEETVGERLQQDEQLRNTVNSILGANVIPAQEQSFDESPLVTDKDIAAAAGDDLEVLDQQGQAVELGDGTTGTLKRVRRGDDQLNMIETDDMIYLLDPKTNEIIEQRDK